MRNFLHISFLGHFDFSLITLSEVSAELIPISPWLLTGPGNLWTYFVLLYFVRCPGVYLILTVVLSMTVDRMIAYIHSC